LKNEELQTIKFHWY